MVGRSKHWLMIVCAPSVAIRLVTLMRNQSTLRLKPGMKRGVSTPPMVSDLPVSAVRFGLPAERKPVEAALAVQLTNGEPAAPGLPGTLDVTQGEPARIVVGTPSAAQFAFLLAPLLMFR